MITPIKAVCQEGKSYERKNFFHIGKSKHKRKNVIFNKITRKIVFYLLILTTKECSDSIILVKEFCTFFRIAFIIALIIASSF